jgi:arylsulfatase A-like enzyme
MAPNVLWICTDQQRWDTLSYFRHKGAMTPNIDRLARRGVAFSRAYCQSPICTPSRASFLTGLYPIAHQVHRNGNIGFPPTLKLVPRLFRDAGYHTALIGKLHLSRAQGLVEKRPEDGYDEFYWSQHPWPDWETGHDYQDWLKAKGVDAEALFKPLTRLCEPGVPAEFHQTTWAGERARAFIESHRDKPWLLSMNLYDPHPPFDPPPEYFSRFDPADMPPPLFSPGDIAHQVRFAEIDQQARAAVDPTHYEDDADYFERQGVQEGALHDTPPTKYNARALRAAYHAMILQIDDMIGGLLDTLEATDQADDTLIVFMSDHGEMLGDHGLIYKGCRFYEGLVHVPLIISWPARISFDRPSNALVELVDIPPTLLDAAGIAVPTAMQGASLLPLLLGEADHDTHKPYVQAEYFDALRFPGSRGSRGSMYFDGRYKLAVYHDIGEGELFDHVTDPDECHDLWSDPASSALKADLMARHFSAMMKVSGAGSLRTADY